MIGSSPVASPGPLPGRERGLSERARAWLVALVVLALAATYVVVWGTYAYVHMSSSVRYRVLGPGQPATIASGRVRLIDLSLARTLSSTYESLGPSRPDPGALWAVAAVEVTLDPGRDDPLCVFELVGPDRRVWEPSFGVTGRKLPGSCSDDEVPRGRPTRIEVVFQVPEVDADGLIGVAVSGGDSWHRIEVLRA